MNVFLFFFPISNKILNFVRIAISRGKFETRARICFGFLRLNSKLSRRNSKLFQGFESKAHKLFKIQGNPPDHQHRKRIKIKQKCKKLYQKKEKKKKSNCKGRRVNIFNFPVSTPLLCGCQIYL